jgi:glycosyltransferase involved in cell wall biosynthesis
VSKVIIAMAVYDPNLDWLEAQLRSIAAQTHRDIEVLACDDASPAVPHGTIRGVFVACLPGIPYTLIRNHANLGHARTFELLTEQAGGDYISYCDQDDIWHPRKTAGLLRALRETGAALAYSDLSVIDAEGNTTAASLRHVRRRLRHRQGEGLAKTLLFRNFTNGTAMMMPAQMAKDALPFVTGMIADHWLTLYASTRGTIAYVPEPLVKYRLHGGNQSAVLAGVTDKRSYLERRILPGVSRFEQFHTRLADVPGLAETVREGLVWFRARKDWFEHGKGAGLMWRRRNLGKQVTAFELLAARLPEACFMALVKMVQRGLL